MTFRLLLKENPPPPPVCVPKMGLKFSGPFDKFHFLPEENFSDVGWWVGRPGLARASNTPPPTPRGL